jgi:phage baseplate assembly protein W
MDRSAMSRAINYPYSLDPVGVTEATEQANKIWLDRLLTLLSTNVGQRPMLTSYGTDLMRALFENENVLDTSIKQAVSTAVTVWLPEIKISSISTVLPEYGGQAQVTITVILPDSTIKTLDVSSAIFSSDGTVTAVR